MNEIDKMMLEIDAKIEEANRQKEEIARQQKAVRASLKELEAAKRHVEKAQAVVDGDVVVTTTTARPKKETVHVVVEEKPAAEETVIVEKAEPVVYETEKQRKDNTSVGFLTGFATCGIVAMLVAGAWVLNRDSIVGEVRGVIPTPNTDEDAITEDVNEVERADHGMTYDYDNNVVVITNMPYSYDFNGTNDAETTEMGQKVLDAQIADIPVEAPYVALTTERFEALATDTVVALQQKGLQVSSEDVIKYVMIRNLDKLRQDNNELIGKIVGDQNIFEFITDACTVMDAMRNYNLATFDATRSTDGFISATIGVFDETQLARATELERRIYEIAEVYQNDEAYNEKSYVLMRDMLNPLNPVSQLEDGISYGMELVDMYMVRTRFGQDKNNQGFNDVNRDLVKYFVSFPEDEDEYTDNSLMNGNVTNIINNLNNCNAKTRTK